MAQATSAIEIVFPYEPGSRSEYETPSRGYLSHVVVRLEDGSAYQMCFMDPVRLSQDLEGEVACGRGYFAEPNLIVLPVVNTESVQKAIHGLAQEGFFKLLKPMSG
jgi:hypothetical protein